MKVGAPQVNLVAAVAGLCMLVAGPLARAATLQEPIVMMWQVNGDAAPAEMRKLAQMGINTIQSFPLRKAPPAYVSRYLDAAAKAGLRVIPSLGSEGKGESCGLSAAGESFLRQYAAHPAIAAWHSVDEPAYADISKDCQRRVYTRIKALDSKPIMVSINFSSQRQYNNYFAEDAFDVLDLHKYVNPGIASAQRNLINLFLKNKTREYPVIVTLRTFNAPTKLGRRDIAPGNLFAQYTFFFQERRIGANIGLYGWRLAPNKGITQVDWLLPEVTRLLGQHTASVK